MKTKIKKEFIEEVRVWFQTLKSQMEEMLISLENEKVLVESAFLDKQGDDFYLIYYVKAENLSYAYKVFKKSTMAIDDYYKQCWKKYCEGHKVLEELLDLHRLNV